MGAAFGGFAAQARATALQTRVQVLSGISVSPALAGIVPLPKGPSVGAEGGVAKEEVGGGVGAKGARVVEDGISGSGAGNSASATEVISVPSSFCSGCSHGSASHHPLHSTV